MSSFHERLLRFPVCSFCQALFLGCKPEWVCLQSNESIIKECERKRKSLKDLPNEVPTICTPPICPNCWDVLDFSSLNSLIDSIAQRYQTQFPQKSLDEKRTIELDLSFPAILDVPRILFRTYLTSTTDKTISFTTIDALLRQYLVTQLQIRYKIIVVPSNADIIVKIRVLIEKQREVLHLYFTYLTSSKAITLTHNIRNKLDQAKARKRKAEEVNGNGNTESSDISEDWTRSEIDQYLIQLREEFQPHHNLPHLTQTCEKIITDVHHFLYSDLGGNSSPDVIPPRQCVYEFGLDSFFPPIYVLGRYNKYARDVPQSPWSLTSTPFQYQPNSNDDTGEDEGDIPDEDRKGRYSVEEIIASYIYEATSCHACTLHGCGREDIDVRCLGNGRPFCLQILQARKIVTDTMLVQITADINQCQRGLNIYGDIKVSKLSVTTSATWERMQVEAEEKRKGYCCLVYTTSPLTPTKLRLLEEASKRDVDEEGIPCLRVCQKTPLRVMHRRSLLERDKYIYHVRTYPLNSHYFLMRLVTSAGAYVKEFVHGDFGRTLPSVKSMLGCRAEILQLDVTWLYDSIHEGQKEESEDGDSEGWTWTVLKQRMIHNKV